MINQQILAFPSHDQAPETVSRRVRDYIPRANKDFKVEDESSGGGWVAGDYEFAMAYELHGEVGPMSDPIQITIAQYPSSLSKIQQSKATLVYANASTLDWYQYKD